MWEDSPSFTVHHKASPLNEWCVSEWVHTGVCRFLAANWHPSSAIHLFIQIVSFRHRVMFQYVTHTDRFEQKIWSNLFCAYGHWQFKRYPLRQLTSLLTLKSFHTLQCQKVNKNGAISSVSAAALWLEAVLMLEGRSEQEGSKYSDESSVQCKCAWGESLKHTLYVLKGA